MGKKTRRIFFRLDEELYDWLLRFSRSAGKAPSEIARTAVDAMMLYYLGESVSEGKGLDAIHHMFESLARRIEIISRKK